MVHNSVCTLEVPFVPRAASRLAPSLHFLQISTYCKFAKYCQMIMDPLKVPQQNDPSCRLSSVGQWVCLCGRPTHQICRCKRPGRSKACQSCGRACNDSS